MEGCSGLAPHIIHIAIHAPLHGEKHDQIRGLGVRVHGAPTLVPLASCKGLIAIADHVSH